MKVAINYLYSDFPGMSFCPCMSMHIYLQAFEMPACLAALLPFSTHMSITISTHYLFLHLYITPV